MPAKKRKAEPKAVTFGPRSSTPKPFLGLAFLILGLLLVLAVGDYQPSQNPLFFSDIEEDNLVGIFGVQVAYYLLLAVGVGAFAVPFITFWLAYLFFRPYARKLTLRKVPAALLVVASTAVFGTLYQIESAGGAPPGKVGLDAVASNFYPFGRGGWLGFWIYAQFLREFLSMVGSLVVFGVLGLFSLGYLLFDNLGHDLRQLFKVRIAAWVSAREARREAQRKEADAGGAPVESAPEPIKAAPPSTPPPARRPTGISMRESGEARPFDPIMEAPGGPAKAMPSANGTGGEAPAEKPSVPLKLGGKATRKRTTEKASDLHIIPGEEVRKAEVKLPEQRGNFRFPPMRLLAEPRKPVAVEDAEAHRQTAAMLVRTLEEFGVRVTTGDVHTGPVITRYDVYPAPGVRVEKIQNLDKNLALNLKALSVRILAPVPGKGCVGIEVPNKHPQAVFIRDILESEDWVRNKAEIPIALGKEVSGKPLIADLTKMPHLLIAGSTGSGKTVCINAVVTSLLYHSSPEDIRFVMVDPKIVEMQVYNSLPHMLVPVVTDPKKVPNALKYLLNEMERRYQLFAGLGVRNIAGYNARMAKNRQEAREAQERAEAMDAELTPEERAAAAAVEVPRDPDAGDLPRKLPYIVCIVDELADLMMVAPADIETGIARLAQLARAAGIHLILATQRPSVNVITGVIKANLPSRISFKVASRVDSRTILDTMGADHLIGKGDMLFLPPGSADLVRAQGAFVSDEEITGIVNHIREVNGEPIFDEQFQMNIEADGEDGPGSDSGDWDDDLVPDAIEVIRTSKRASTSMLQRRLKIGYNRAARIMEILEGEGMVGPENGSSPREILMDLDR